MSETYTVQSVGTSRFKLIVIAKIARKKKEIFKWSGCSRLKKYIPSHGHQLISHLFTFENKVFLGAICRALLKENLYEIAPFSNSEVILTPTDILRKKLYSSLIHNQVIAVSPQSPLDAFDIDSEDFPNIFYIYRVTYFLNLIFPANKQDLFTEILDPSYYCPENADEAVMLWKEIAVAECIEYLHCRFVKHVGR